MKYIYITSLSDTINGVDMVVSRIKDYIDKFYKELSSNEMLTRQVIINRVLELIGYDPRDPSKVICEYSTLTGKTDYAILMMGNLLQLLRQRN